MYVGICMNSMLYFCKWKSSAHFLMTPAEGGMVKDLLLQPQDPPPAPWPPPTYLIFSLTLVKTLFHVCHTSIFSWKIKLKWHLNTGTDWYPPFPRREIINSTPWRGDPHVIKTAANTVSPAPAWAHYLNSGWFNYGDLWMSDVIFSNFR